MAISFDGPNKLMVLSSGTTTLSVRDLWSRWVDWYLTSDNSKYLPALENVGGNDIDEDEGTKIPIYAFCINEWKLRPQEATHTLKVGDGILLVSGGGDPFVDTLGSYVVRINYQQPVQAISFSTGEGGTGEADWTTTERSQIRHRLGIDGSVVTPSATPSLGTLANQQTIISNISTIDGIVDNIQLDTNSIESKVDTLTGDVSDMQGDVTDIKEKLDSVEGKVNDVQDDTNSIESKVDIIDGIVDNIQLDTNSIESKVDIIDGIVDNIQLDTNSIESKVDIVDTNVDTILINLATSNVGINTLLDVEQGDWSIVGNQMVFYTRTGTELMRFDLVYDGVNVVARERV